MFYYRERGDFEDFLDEISAGVRQYRDERCIAGTALGDIRLARAYYLYKKSDPFLDLQSFLEKCFFTAGYLSRRNK